MPTLKEQFELFTVEDVAALFPAVDERKKKAHVEAVEELIAAHGIYRKFGEKKFLTRTDIDALFRAIAHNSRASDGAPALKSEGHVVFIGNRTMTDVNVYIGWAPIGGVDVLVRNVQDHADTAVQLLDYAAGTYEAYLGVCERLKRERHFGNWFYRTKETQTLMDEIFLPKRTTDE
jgi:hypothetical protein